MDGALQLWQALLAVTAAVFTRPSFELFGQIATGWILCPGRRTITGMLPTADPEGKHPHDAFHRFFRLYPMPAGPVMAGTDGSPAFRTGV